MKKNILVFMILTAVLMNGFSQSFDKNEKETSSKNKDNEVYLAVGTPSLMSYATAVFVDLGNAIVNSEPSSSKSSSFSFAGGYNHYFYENFAVGVTFGYEKFNNVEFFSGSAKILTQYGFKHFKFYHAVNVGLIIFDTAENLYPYVDLTYLGLKLDFYNYNFFVDASFPMSALIKAGVSFKF